MVCPGLLGSGDDGAQYLLFFFSFVKTVSRAFFPISLTIQWFVFSFSPSILRPWRFLPWSPCLHLKLHGTSLVLFSVNLAPLTFSSLEPLLALETAWRPSRPFLRQFDAPDVFFPGVPCLHLKLHGTSLVLFSVNLAPLTFSSMEPLLTLETAWRPSRPFLRQFDAPDVFFPGVPCLHLKLHGTSLVLFSVNLAPLTFSSMEPLLTLEHAWRISRPFLRQFCAPDVFFPGAPACTWNCMAHLSSFSPSIWRPWRFLPWSPCLHLKLHGASLVLFSVNFAPLTFSSLEPLLALETAWRPSRPFLCQFCAPDVFFPGAPAYTWNCMAPLSSFSPSIWPPPTFSSLEPRLALETAWRPLSSFSPSIWHPWRFLPWSPCLHLNLHGAPLVLFSVSLAPLTLSSLEPLLALETAWRPSRPFLRQFGAPDVFFPGAPAYTWNCMAPLSSFSPSILRPWRFLPWSPLFALETALHLSRPFLRQFGAPDVFFHGAPANTWTCMAPLSSFSPSIWRPWCFLPWSPLLALETARRPSRHIDLTFFLSFFFLAPSFYPFFFLIPFFFLFSPSLFLSLSFFSFFLAPL